MKKSPSERTRHVVAWMNKAEWDEVLDFLFSKDPQLQKHALHRISAWKVRFGHGTPVAVESTADLVRCQVLDRSGRLESDELVLLYGMALVRFVNLITERKQKGVARPLRRLASNLKIPEWIVNLRHELTHQRLPTLKSCREGCRFVLDWLLQEYWSRQLGSRLADDWDSQSEEEVDDEEWARRGEEELLARQKEIESHKKARELLVSYEREQRQTLEELVRQRAQHGLWPEPNTDLSWILAQIKHFAAESREVLAEMLVQDGFLIPTQEQLEFLDIDPSENFDPMAPCLPRVYLRLWQPLLKSLNFSFIHLLLEKLFAELAAKPGSHQGFYISAWIAEILLCNRVPYRAESKARKTRMKDRIFTNRFPLRWQQLLTACTNAPCIATPYLLQLLLEDMDKPLPPDTQRKLLRLCSIYTQGGCHDDDEDSLTDPDPAQPIYTVQSLKDGLLKGNTHSALRSPNHCCPPLAPPTQDLQEQLSAEALEERNFALHGSPWQVCTDKVNWKLYPLGQAPGQSGSPSCLMLENYSTLTIFDQQVELDKAPQHHNNSSISNPNRSASDGLLWSHADLSKLKSGLKLF